MRFSETVSGFGVGVSVGQFEVDVYDELGVYGEALLENATLQIVEADNYCLPSKTYYISKRSINNKVCHFVAYDIMSRVEQNFDFAYLTIVDENNIPCANVINAICTQCGFSAARATGEGIEHITFTKNQLENRTCRAILEMIAEVMQGVWIAHDDGSIILSCIGAPYDPTYHFIDAEYYTEIDYQGKQKITGIVFTNSETGKVNVQQTGDYGVIINITSPFVAKGTALDTLVWERLKNHIYQAWHCDKAVVDGLAVATSQIGFSGTEMLANSVSLEVDSTGIYFSGGCEPQDEEQWRYEEYLERAKVGIDKLIGHTKITNTGRIEFINLNK